jgi:hypothetical protein
MQFEKGESSTQPAQELVRRDRGASAQTWIRTRADARMAEFKGHPKACMLITIRYTLEHVTPHTWLCLVGAPVTCVLHCCLVKL